jgi:hypothetical protein
MTRAALPVEPRDWCSLTLYYSRMYVSARIAANVARSLPAAGIAPDCTEGEHRYPLIEVLDVDG